MAVHRGERIAFRIFYFERNKQTKILTDTNVPRQQIKWERNLFDSWSRKAALILTTKVPTNLSVNFGRNILSQRGRNILLQRQKWFVTETEIFCNRCRNILSQRLEYFVTEAGRNTLLQRQKYFVTEAELWDKIWLNWTLKHNSG